MKSAALTRARPALSGFRSEPGTDLVPWEALQAALPGRAGLPVFVWESPDGGMFAGLGAVAGRALEGTRRFEEAKELARELRSDGIVGISEGDLRFMSGFAFDSAEAAGDGLPSGAIWLPERSWVRERGGSLTEISWERTPASDDSRGPSLFRELSSGSKPAIAGRDWTAPEWDRAVKEALDRIEQGEIEKIVLARSREMEGARPWNPVSVFETLRAAYPESFRYYLDDGNGRVFLGASPERLVSLRDGRIEADAVAGTARDGEDWASDTGVAQMLRSDPKERREHEIVVREILASLSGCSRNGNAPAEPSVERYRRLLHLRTRITAAALPGAHILDLVSKLHPTPAVAGSPSESALEFLRSHEPRSRGWYAGPIGWMDGAGNGDFTVGLRSALLEGNRALLLAGAGIVLGSDPEREWKECESKMACLEEILNRG